LTGKNASLVCVDPWSGSFARNAESVFDRSILSTGRSEIVKKIRGRSEIVLSRFPDNHFDGIYIDGDHEGRAVLLDGLNALRVLKPGGVLLFDDYKWRGVESGVSVLPGIAIDCFLDLCSSSLEIMHKGYQLAVRKKESLT
jgi:predicted O-methyltransferase YrrM